LKGLKVYIHTDIEGVSGVVEWDPRKSNYSDIEKYYKKQEMCRLLTGEVNAAVRAARDAGATTIYVSDSHGSARNILIEMLEPEAELLHGVNSLQPNWVPCLDGSFDAVVAVGMHAMAGTRYASLPHSMWHINDDRIQLSEAGMCAALSGCFNVPFVFISGDQQVTGELREKVPNVEIAVVKEALSPYFARCLHPAKARQLIYEGVKKGIENRLNIRPYKIKGPYKINVSDRDPEIKLLDEDVTGEELFETVHRALNKMPWNDFGSQEIENKVTKLQK